MKYSKPLHVVTYLALPVLGIAVAVLFLGIDREQLGATSEKLESLRWSLAPVRWSVFVWVIWHWSQVCQFIGRYKKLNSDSLDELRAARGLVVRVVLLVEVFVNLPTLPFLIDLLR